MPVRLTVTELVRNFAEYINRVVYRRESFVLLRGNKPVAELKPLPSGLLLGELPNLLESLPHLHADEAVALATDLEAAREELGRREVDDPWEF